MSRLATLSTNIDGDLKKALSLYCKKKGLKIQSVVEMAIREQLEDEIDLAAYLERKNEAEVTLEQLLKTLKA
jgi:antitoxin component of RelBE/YafQ-DinJ toxin-antitoxin module